MRTASAVLLALVLGMTVGPVRAQISGDLRESFTRSFKASCLVAQKANGGDRDLSDNLLQQYCACNAAFIAERVTTDELAAAAAPAKRGMVPSWFTERAKAASSYCSEDLSKYASVSS